MTGFRVQMGTVSFGASASTKVVTIPRKVNPTRAFPRLTCVENGGTGRTTASTANLNSDDLGAGIVSWNGTSFTLVLTGTHEAVDHTYLWEVWSDEMSNFHHPTHGWEVRGIVSLSMAPTVTTATSAVLPIQNYLKCIPFPIGVRASIVTRNWPAANASLVVNSDNTVTATRSSTFVGGTTIIDVALVEFGVGWTINNNLTVAYPNGLLTHEIPGAGSDPWTQKFIIPTGHDGSTGTSIQDHTFMVRPKPGDNTVALLNANPDSTGVPVTENTATVHVASHPLMVVEHQNTIDDAIAKLSGSEATEALLAPLSSSLATRTGSVVSAACRGTLQYPGQMWGYRVEPTQMFFRRGRTGGAAINNCEYASQVIMLPLLPPDGGSGLSIGNAVSPSGIGAGITPTAFGSGG